jgi:hypothetical protein
VSENPGSAECVLPDKPHHSDEFRQADPSAIRPFAERAIRRFAYSSQPTSSAKAVVAATWKAGRNHDCVIVS